MAAALRTPLHLGNLRAVLKQVLSGSPSPIALVLGAGVEEPRQYVC